MTARGGCPAVRHGGDLAAYVAGCRCEQARDAMRRYEGRRQMLAARGTTLTVPVTGTVRRVRALMRLGWTAARIGEQSGQGRAMVQRLSAACRPRVNVATERRVRQAFDVLSGSVGPSARTAARARRAGWAPPLAWDCIDDPSDRPHGVADDVSASRDRRAERRRQVADLTAKGVSVPVSAAVLGVTTRTVERDRHRNLMKESA
jgi:hypothetical protein